jgi:hypothetical protein
MRVFAHDSDLLIICLSEVQDEDDKEWVAQANAGEDDNWCDMEPTATLHYPRESDPAKIQAMVAKWRKLAGLGER